MNHYKDKAIIFSHTPKYCDCVLDKLIMKQQSCDDNEKRT